MLVLRSFKVSIISVIIFLALISLLTRIISPNDFGMGDFIQILFYGAATFIPLVFGVLVLLNLLVEWRIKATSTNNPNSVYFFWSIILALLPVLGFVIFDYSHRGRSFEKLTFLSISAEYSVSFVLALIAILLNRKIVWNNFKKPVA